MFQPEVIAQFPKPGLSYPTSVIVWRPLWPMCNFMARLVPHVEFDRFGCAPNWLCSEHSTPRLNLLHKAIMKVQVGSYAYMRPLQCIK